MSRTSLPAAWSKDSTVRYDRFGAACSWSYQPVWMTSRSFQVEYTEGPYVGRRDDYPALAPFGNGNFIAGRQGKIDWAKPNAYPYGRSSYAGDVVYTDAPRLREGGNPPREGDGKFKTPSEHWQREHINTRQQYVDLSGIGAGGHLHARVDGTD